MWESVVERLSVLHREKDDVRARNGEREREREKKKKKKELGEQNRNTKWNKIEKSIIILTTLWWLIVIIIC